MPKLILMDAAGNVRQIPLSPPALTLGRGSNNDVVLDSKRASRSHAVVELDGPRAYITDLHSLNGTLVNGQLIDRRPLAHGDAIEIGSVLLRFVALDQVLSDDEAMRLLTAPSLQMVDDWDFVTLPDEPRDRQRRRC